ncbi:hypothetical protein ABRT01_17090 [Lentibacillus sp. L22]|uniref:hypothetical protein n=1 Tax=Lentibacillus TaxID=175304 RepID=UPI0022B11A79|nr:hypothetical protein [Lentibacillus daqui]
MIVPITGNVAYPITLDPTVWIFDARKILLEDAFVEKAKTPDEDLTELQKASERWDRAVSPSNKTSVNPGISRKEGERILKNSYVIPIKDFVNNAEPNEDATNAVLITTNAEIRIELEDFINGLFLFSFNGKPLKDGPLHFFYHDGSNKDNPVKCVTKIVIE